jgi:hypothetical protein
VDWMHLVQDRNQLQAFLNTVMNPDIPWKVGSFLTSWVPTNFSRRTLIHVVS